MQRRRRGPRCMSVGWTLLVVTLLSLSVPASAELEITLVRHPYSGKMVEAAAGQVIVVYKPGTLPGAQVAATRGVGSGPIGTIIAGRVVLASVPAGSTIEATIEQYKALPEVELAEANYIAHRYGSETPTQTAAALAAPLQVTPNDPLWPNTGMYGLRLLQCPYAWEVQTGASTKIIAIIDEGVDLTHQDLTGKAWVNAGETPGDGVDNDGNGYIDDVNGGWDFADDDNDPVPVAPVTWEEHGTHVAGTASAKGNNAIGVASVCWGTKIMSCRVLGQFGGTYADIMEGIVYAGRNGADVINMSLGGPYSAAVQTSIDSAYNDGTVICAAAGNSNWEFTTNPATWDSPVCNDGADPSTQNRVIGVAATDSTDVRASFSNYSGAYKLLDVSAPGVDILSTLPGNTYGGPGWSGTSMASPHVAGVAGLLVSEHPAWSVDTVINQIRDTADFIDDKNPFYAGKLGTGRVNAANAVGVDLPPGPATRVAAIDTPNDEGGSVSVTWRRSRDDGSGQNDIVKYQVHRAEGSAAGPFVSIAGDLAPGTQSYTNAPTVDGTNYYYFVRVFDAANQVDSTVVGPVRSRDDLAPPKITNLVARDRDSDTGGVLELTWGPYAPPADFSQYRLYRSDRDFSSVSGMTPLTTIGSPGVLSYTDQSPDLRNGTKYYYAVTATDDSAPPNENTAVTTASATPAVDFEYTFPVGISMAAMPAYPFDPSPVTVFGVSPPPGAEMARWDAQMYPAAGYHYSRDNPNDPFLSVVPGRGFWLKLPAARLVSVDGTAVPAATGQDFTVAIVPGWQQVGNPFTTALDFTTVTITVAGGEKTLNEASASGIAENYAWLYNAPALSYQLLHASIPFAVQSIPAYHGLWFRSYASATLNLPKPVGALSVQPRAAAAGRQPSAQDWAIPIVASIPARSVSDAATVLGVHPDAAAISHIQSPPNPSPYVDVYFPPADGQVGLRYATDFVSSLAGSHTWELVADTDITDADVVLTFPDLSELPRAYHAFIVDRDAGTRQSLRTNASYRYRSVAAGERHFALEVTTDASATLTVGSVSAVPTRGPGADISFSLSQPAQVQVEVVNAAGRVLRVLSGTAVLPIGRNAVLWNGRNSLGALTPSGVYLVRIQAVAEDGQRASGVAALALTRERVGHPAARSGLPGPTQRLCASVTKAIVA